jgi:sec-independent protein translocase protein TatB
MLSVSGYGHDAQQYRRRDRDTLAAVFGLTFDKLLIVAVIAAFLLGPERLPTYAAKLGKFTRSLRDFANGAKSRMRDEMGPEFDEVDWKKLDPRQYDPRRIIREALLDDPAAASVATESSIKPVTESAYLQHKRKLEAGAVPPFDSEST